MYSQLAIVVLIDTEEALKAGSLSGHTYLVDNARTTGSTGEGTNHLVTRVEGNRIMNWLVSGIDIFGNQPNPVLVKICGEAVERQVMVPQLFDSPALDGSRGLWWGASVDANTSGTHSYTLVFQIGNRELDFVSSIEVVPGFTMDTATTMSSSTSLSRTRARRSLVSFRAAPIADDSGSSLQASAVADGSLHNAGHHASLFTQSHLSAVRELRRKVFP